MDFAGVFSTAMIRLRSCDGGSLAVVDEKKMKSWEICLALVQVLNYLYGRASQYDPATDKIDKLMIKEPIG
mgnify:CR=1 FL=1